VRARLDALAAPHAGQPGLGGKDFLAEPGVCLDGLVVGGHPLHETDELHDVIGCVVTAAKPLPLVVAEERMNLAVEGRIDLHGALPLAGIGLVAARNGVGLLHHPKVELGVVGNDTFPLQHGLQLAGEFRIGRLALEIFLRNPVDGRCRPRHGLASRQSHQRLAQFLPVYVEDRDLHDLIAVAEAGRLGIEENDEIRVSVNPGRPLAGCDPILGFRARLT
jgi:hypothetical protein